MNAHVVLTYDQFQEITGMDLISNGGFFDGSVIRSEGAHV
jgi:hypothetical protein